MWKLQKAKRRPRSWCDNEHHGKHSPVWNAVFPVLTKPVKVTPLDSRWLSQYQRQELKQGSFLLKRLSGFAVVVNEREICFQGQFSVLFLLLLYFFQGCPPEGANKHRVGQPMTRLFLSRDKSPKRWCRNTLGAVATISGYSTPTAKGDIYLYIFDSSSLEDEVSKYKHLHWLLICRIGALTLLKRFVHTVGRWEKWSLWNAEHWWTIPDHGLQTSTQNWFIEVGGLYVWYNIPCSTQ